jgi:hypothetical protein
MIDGLKLAVTGEEHAKLLERLSKVAGEMTAAHFALAARSARPRTGVELSTASRARTTFYRRSPSSTLQSGTRT